MNETQHIGMRDAHHSHVCTAPHTALLHDISHLIDDIHERHWTRSDTHRRADARSVWSQEFVSHASATAGLVNRCRSRCVLHYPLKRIGNLQNKARSQLTICLTSV